VGHDDADETDQATHGDCGSGAERCRDHHDEANTTRSQSECRRFFVADGHGRRVAARYASIMASEIAA
jgi:hypothetical protein